MKELNQTQSVAHSNGVIVPWVRNILGFGTIVILCSFIWSTYGMVQKYRATLHLSQQQADLTTQNIADAIDSKLTKLAFAANELAGNLSGISLNKTLVESTLKQSALNHTEFYALGVAFDLHQVSPQLRLFSPFIRQDGTTYISDNLDRYYDYIGNATQPQTNNENNNWFAQASAGKNGWLPPFYDIAYQQYTLKYVAPLTADTQTGEIRGTVFVDIGLEWIRQQVENHDVGDNGYAIILNEFGQTLYHNLKGSQKIVANLNKSIPPAYIAGFKTGELGKNELTGRAAWLHKYPIGSTGWHVLTVMNTGISKKHLFSHNQTEQSIQKSDVIVWIINAVFLCLVIYLWVAIIKRQHAVAHLWRHAFIVSLLFTLGITAIWICETYASPPAMQNSLILSNRAIVKQFQNDYAIHSLKEFEAPLLYIPTGLFIQSIEFENATNVTLSGYLWQRYPRDYEEAIEHGVIFPEAVQTTMNEISERIEGDEIIKSWYFETTLRESFDYSVYPFDRQLLWVRLWHKNFSENVTLIPDFKSYDSLNPNTLPGIEKDFVLSAWNLSRTFYDIRINHYNTNFGNTNYTSRDRMPELYFNIELSRSILNPFIAHSFPLSVVLLMLYALVLTISRHEARQTMFGFNVSTIIASCSALFFILLIMHVQLRDELATNTIVYMEYYYLVSYVAILMVTINAILFSWDPPIRLLEFKDNLIPKLIYWPILLAWLFAITIILF